MSQASTRFGLDSSISLEDVKGLRRRAVERVKQVSTSQDIFLFLVAFRILNALSIKTFFQPDEYFQSLEPAWQIAFGKDSGAWITWVNKIATKRVQTADVACRSGRTIFDLPYIQLYSLLSTNVRLALPGSCDYLPPTVRTS